MVFSSVPVYLDPPNWQQQTIYQPNHQPSGGSNENNQKLLPPPPPPPPTSTGGSASVRPPGMADRARLAKLPQPDQLVPQKCPRCDSTNTKFCYFNNYSLTQPRHFCKTCRRYWARGGALRSVPVGGGCRRNKRSSKGSTTSSRSKSPATGAAGSSSTSSAANNSVIHANACTASDMLGHLSAPPSQQHHHPHLPFFPPLHSLSNFGTGDHNIGLNFGGGGGGGSSGVEMGFLGSSSNGGGGGDGGGHNFSSGGLGEQWRIMPQVQQFHFLAAAGLEQPPSGLYQYDQQGEGGVDDQPPSYTGQLRAKQPLDFGVNTTNLASVKSEGNQQGLNLSRNFLGTVQGNDQYWGSSANNNAWTDLSGFNSSSTSHLL